MTGLVGLAAPSAAVEFIHRSVFPGVGQQREGRTVCGLDGTTAQPTERWSQLVGTLGCGRQSLRKLG